MRHLIKFCTLGFFTSYAIMESSHELWKLVGLHSSFVVETHVAALLIFDDSQDVQMYMSI